MLSECITRAIEHHGYQLAAFVFMPEHVHLIVWPTDGAGNIDALLKTIKRPFSYRVKTLLMEAKSPLLDRLMIRQRPGVTTFRFWQEGPGYDRNITEVSTALAAVNYLHENPIRRGLVGQAINWKWSSALFYLYDPPRQYSGLPIVFGLPHDWLNGSS